MNEGITFNGEGPLMTGTWYNPSNGDSFTVADAFFQDNQYIVKTTDGRMLDYNFIQHYIKSDKPIAMPKNEPTTKLPPEVQSIIANQNDDILPEDQLLIQGQAKPIGNLYNNPATITNTHIIDKALSKKTIPELTSIIVWKDFPKKELDMLMDVLDIDKNEILDWYINKIDINVIKNSIKESLIDWFDKKLNGNEKEPIVEELFNEKETIKEPKTTNVTRSKSTRSKKKGTNGSR